MPAQNLIGEEGKGFRYILDGMNAERILIAAECIGDGYWFIEKAANYAIGNRTCAICLSPLTTGKRASTPDAAQLYTGSESAGLTYSAVNANPSTQSWEGLPPTAIGNPFFLVHAAMAGRNG